MSAAMVNDDDDLIFGYNETATPEQEQNTLERDWWIRCRVMNGLDIAPEDLAGDRWQWKQCGVDWVFWRNRPVWTADQAARLAIGIDPSTAPERLCDEAEMMIRKAALDICSLPPRQPAEWVQTLVNVGFDDLPPPMYALLDDELGYVELKNLAVSRRSAPQAEPARDGATTGKGAPNEPPPLPDPASEAWREDSMMGATNRTRTDCLKDAMLAAVATLRRELGRDPNMGEVRVYLRDRDSSGYIKSVTDALVTWLDWAGKRHTADARNLNQRLKGYLKIITP